MTGRFALLAAALAAAVPGFAAEPQWVFNHGDDAGKTRVAQGAVEHALGLYRLTATGTDLTLTVPYASADAFKAAERPYLAIRYRIRSPHARCGVFFTTDTMTSLSDKSYSSFKIEPDGQWHNVVVDMRVQKPAAWKGTVTGFRIDPTNPSRPGDVDEFSRLGFFATQAAAEAFLAAADDSEDYTQELVVTRETFRFCVPAGKVTPGWKESDYALADVTVPAGEGALCVCCDGEPVPSHVNGKGFAVYVAERRGTYRLVRGVEPARLHPLDAETARRFGCGVSPMAFPASHFARERIRLGGWGMTAGNVWSRRQARDFAACGLDFLIANGRDSGGDAGALLAACDEEGIEACMHFSVVGTDLTKVGLAHEDHPSYRGLYLTDEPGTDAYDSWGKLAKDCREKTGKMPFINLLPMYANAAQLKFGAGAAAIEYYDADPDLYRKYCEAYCDKVPTEYICTDIYPFNWTKSGQMTTYRDYVESINVIASVARERNREFWCCLQTFGWCSSKRTPNAAEFRWQCYSLLSFGCRALLCWVYAPYNPNFPSLVDIRGERTAAWYDARTVFQEIRNLSDVYCSYRNLGAFTHNCTDKTPYLKMSGECRDFATVRSVSCDAPLLVGCFAAKTGEGTAFTVVNMNDFARARSALARFDIDGKSVKLYRRGVGERLRPGPDGRYDIALECGEGVFVTVQR